MAQGTRGRLLMAATAGVGIVLIGLAGCQNTDKTNTKATTKSAPGLYGTPTLNGTSTSANKTQPNYGNVANSPIQTTSGAQVPGQGLGAGQAPYTTTQFGSGNGNNTLNTPALPTQNYGQSGVGAPTPLGTPARSGIVNPAGGPVGAASPPSMGFAPGGSLSAAPATPSVPLLDMPPMPPLPPPGAGLASGAGPVAPPLPSMSIPPTLPATGTSAIAPTTTSTAFSSAGVLPLSP